MSTPSLDFISFLPQELVSYILSYLPFSSLTRASCVSKSWRAVIDTDSFLWERQLKVTGIWFGGARERAFIQAVNVRRQQVPSPSPTLPLPHPYKLLFASRYWTRTSWSSNLTQRRISFPVHRAGWDACLLLSHGRIIFVSAPPYILVYSLLTGKLVASLNGHTGDIRSLASTKDTLVSASFDCTIRIWDLKAGRCTHVFRGLTRSVRCLAIVKPEWLDITGDDAVVRREKWPKQPLIVTGSGDCTLRVWTLPLPSDAEYEEFDDVNRNPYHNLHLQGHDLGITTLAARGRTLASGSSDGTVRIWDIITGGIIWVLIGHSRTVCSVALDKSRNQVYSSSKDSSIRVWNLNTGRCMQTLLSHPAPVLLLNVSHAYLVSVASDSTLCIWDFDTAEVQHRRLTGHIGDITCFQHDDFKVLSCSRNALKMWDIRERTVVSELVTEPEPACVRSAVFKGRWCVAVVSRAGGTMLDVWDFGGTEGIEDWIDEAVDALDEASDDEI